MTILLLSFFLNLGIAYYFFNNLVLKQRDRTIRSVPVCVRESANCKTYGESPVQEHDTMNLN